VDIPFLAQQFELAGGNIRNCVRAAAFIAARSGTSIGMAHLVEGVARELAKLGRPLTRAGFGTYYRQALQPRG
jgi:hypothetical protein